jgi:galactose oxidase
MCLIGAVFHAGPSIAMHWLATTGDGAVKYVGNRPGGIDQMNGNAVMYHQGKILAVGGSTAYSTEEAPVFANAQVRPDELW